MHRHDSQSEDVCSSKEETARWLTGFASSSSHCPCCHVLSRYHYQRGQRIVSAVMSRPADHRVDISIDGQPFTSYIYPQSLEKPVLYPIRSAAGLV